MSTEYLGDKFEIHGGGQDLMFPHHENEIAQTECFNCDKLNGQDAVKYWLHNGFVNINDEKMSKSLNNSLFIKDIIQPLGKYSPMALRWSLLMAHYRSPINFSIEMLDQAEKNLTRISHFYDFLTSSKNQVAFNGIDSVCDSYVSYIFSKQKELFFEAMNDDFNTAVAISHIFKLIDEVKDHCLANSNKQVLFSIDEIIVFNEMLSALGIKLDGGFLKQKESETQTKTEASLLNMILEIRNRARDNKDYETSDFIRHGLNQLGFVLEDNTCGDHH
jgi:cysteinyl-tRNA synthetase